jgi:hypothetical protein
VTDARERRRTAVRDLPRTLADRPAGEDPGGVLALQRSAGNAAVVRALSRGVPQRDGWTGVGKDSPNAGDMTVTDKASGRRARRLAIHGIPQGNQKSDLEDVAVEQTVNEHTPDEHVVKHKTKEFTSESPGDGEAIVVIPDGQQLDETTTVDVLLHLHGHTTGYRKAGKTSRDLGVERIEEQVAAAAAGGQRSLIGVLPQGSFHSWFGTGKQSFDPTDYLNSVWGILADRKVWDKQKPPKRGGLILSGHSGADAPIEDMLAQGMKAGMGEVFDLKALFLLDTMYTKDNATNIFTFVKFRLDSDVAHLEEMRDIAHKTEKERVDWVAASGFRLVAAHSGGHYQPQMKQLAAAVDKYMAAPETIRVLGAPGTPVHAAVAANLVIDRDKASGKDHDSFVGENDHLRKAIETLPGRTP